MTLNDLKNDLHNKLLQLRQIEVIVKQPKFERLWAASNDRQRTAIANLIKAVMVEQVEGWIKHHTSLSFGEMSTIQLKEEASKAKIRNYSRMEKLDLILALEEHYEKSREANTVDPAC